LPKGQAFSIGALTLPDVIMTDETANAFAHPEARAAATEAGVRLRDRISLRDHVVSVDIGAFQTERGLRQRLRFDIVVEVAGAGAEAADDVDRILSYDRLTEAVAAALVEERFNLLETLAEQVAGLILREPQALRVFVRIQKLDRGPGALGVEIARERAASEADNQPEDALRPVVVFLGNVALTDGRLALALDRLAAAAGPLIVCVGQPDGPVPQAGSPAAQRRIDLLAIEQNAWRLAAQDRRCIVTGTRTELDWAMKHGQISVWAPSKIVLDAVDGRAPAGALALAAWFAERMGAAELIVVEAKADIEGPIAMREVTMAEIAA
jgi:7,8-dihydroneopterin aldolase/epimerase/oxygenase